MTFFVNVTSETSLVVGEPVKGRSVGYHRRTGKVAFDGTWSGVYAGIKDNVDGERIHYFEGGEINGYPQTAHGFPVEQYDGVE